MTIFINSMIIGYQGIPGSYSEEVITKHLV